MAFLFGGRVALVTGGGSGIGREVCKLLAERGAIVTATDINHKAVQETVDQLPVTNGSHLALECDVGNGDSVRSCFSQIVERLKKPPTLLANCAGITMDTFLTKMTEDQFDEVIRVNLKGTFLTNQAFALALAAAAKEGEKPLPGAVVNVSSIVGLNGNIGQTNYSASKAGVAAFTKSAAKELARQGVRVNCVYPGFIETPMTDTVPDHLKEMVKFSTDLKRFGQPQEVAEVITFLLSDAASYVTGECMKVTGGL